MKSSDHDAATSFLERLLSLSERSPGRIRPASAAPDYGVLGTAQTVANFHERMAAAERVGAVELRRGRRERRHLIDRVTVKDPVLLARHLGRAPSSEIARQAREVLLSVASTGEPWVNSVLDEMVSRWARSEPAFRLPLNDMDAAKEFITLLSAISKDQARGLDGRTFSLKATGDTKSFDRHAGRLASVLAARFPEAAISAADVWDRIGLERFNHPVHIKGCVVAEDASGILVHGRTPPFASFHPELRPLIKLCGTPSAVLTIENYASFNRYVREINDGSLVVYTGGFASAGVVELLKCLLTLAGPSVPFFHWGDIDPGGLRIFRFLEENLPRRPVPHLMDKGTAQSNGRPASRDPTLTSVAKSDSALASLAAWLAGGDNVMHLEQEALEPVSPLSVT